MLSVSYEWNVKKVGYEKLKITLLNQSRFDFKYVILQFLKGGFQVKV